METRFAGKENSRSFDGLPLEFGVSSSVDLDELVGNKGVSFHSGLSSNVGAQVGQVAGSSKAVLAALRALQDKIRRLEIERSQALEEASQLRQQVKHYEIEIEHTKQREALANQKVMAEATSTKERLYTEKTELEVKLARAADRAAEQAKALGELEFKLRVLEEEKIRARSTIAEFEERTRALEGHMAQSSAREKEVAQTITWETRRHEDEVEALQSHISSLTQDLTTTQERGSELDGMVRQLLASNEALATQLSKAEKRAAKAAAEGGSSSSSSSSSSSRKDKGSSSESKAKESSSGRKKEGSGKVSNKASTTTKQKVAARGLRPSTGAAAGGGSKRTKPSKSRTVVPVFKSLPHCANISTFAAEAQKATKVESSPNHWVPGGLRGVDDIHHQLKSSVESLNSAHSGLASVLSTSRVVVPPPQPRQAPLRGGKSHNSRQRASSVDSRDSRSSVASSTGSACSSASGRHRFSSQSSPGSKNPRGPGIALEGKPHKATTSSASSFWDGYDVLGAVAAKNVNASPGGRPSKAPPKPGSKSSPAAAAKAAANVATQMARAQLATPLVSASPARAPSTQSKPAPQVGTADSFANARDGDLQHVIQSLEEEFSALNHQYRSLLKTVSSPVGKASAETVDASFDDDEKEGQLVDVIQKLHRKSEMLRKLKSPTKR